MKKIASLMLLILCLTGCSNMSVGEKEIIDQYIEFNSDDYMLEYLYLNQECKIISVSYDEVIDKLKSDTFILYVGGYWCPNCQAVISFINDVAKELGIDVYNFDTRIGIDKSPDNDIRNCINKSYYSLYKRFINACGYVNPLGNKTENTDLDRMSVPTLLTYVKGELVGYSSKEYLYDGETLYLPSESELDNKIDYKDSYIEEITELFEKIV